MKLKFLPAVVGLLFLTALLVNGCIFDSGKKINGSDTKVEVPDLEDEFGGYRATNEAPYFGDPAMLAEFGEDQEVTDLLSTDPQIAKDMEDSLVEVYFLRITWGRLDLDTTVTTVTDWSGSAQVDKGALVLLKTIRFDRGDYVHRPRPDRRTLEWTSYTGPHFDGIYLAIVVPPSDTSSAQGTLTFSTTPFSMTFNYSDLDSIDVIYPAGQEGDEISLVGHKKQLVPCGNGYLDGRWTKTQKHQGVCRGRWISRDGSLAGHFQGHWGKRDNGQNMFFGKCIGAGGEFKGLIRARWEYSYSQDEDGGSFAGEWCDRTGEVKGVLGGHFRVGGEKGRKGNLQGQWKLLCP